MRVGTRLFLLKLALAAVVLAAVLVVMHLLLPGLLGRSGAQAPGDSQALAETASVRVAVPRQGGAIRAGPPLAALLAGQVEGLVQGFCSELGPSLGLQPVSKKTTVHVLGSHEEAIALAKQQKLKQHAVHEGAFYDPASLTIAATLKPRPELVAVVLNVSASMLLDRADGGGNAQWSPWLALGLAACAEQGALGPGFGRPGQAARRDAAVVLTLASRAAHVPLHMLVRGGQELFHGPLGSAARREAGLFVLFLLRAGGRHREAFLRYVQLERQPGPVPPGALEATIGTNLSELEREWLTFLQAIARAN